MTTAEALQVVSKLADGVDPVTGIALPRDNPCHHPYVIRALFTVAEQLQGIRARETLRRDAPINAGSAWSVAEDNQLQAEMAAGTKLMAIARAHSRSRGAILARAVRLGHFESIEDARAALENGRHQPSNWEVLKKERPQAGKVWAEHEDDLLLKHFDAGLSPSEIAKQLGRGEFAVRVRLCKFGKVTDGTDEIA